jgi:hypothetical protein
VNWKKAGVAADGGNEWFEFEDLKTDRTPAQFYRIVSP